MPMDYDDNDTSRHNLQVAGEGRNRSSSALRTYDFPKFDFDDSLHGHLRFDSLVETEVFLGIQSQEDNRWIEDFSQVSNGMEFNPTPADSCSIARRNNVWSEATSSESVEMLLKSVGQEEMMPGASIIPESEVTDDQSTLSKYVESSNQLKERNDAYISSSETTLPLDEVPRNHIEDRLEDPLPVHAEPNFECGNSSNINHNSFCGNGGPSTNEVKHSCHDESAVETLEESKASVENSFNSGAGGDMLGMLSSTKASEKDTSIVSHKSGSSDEQKNNMKMTLEETVILDKTAAVVTDEICTGSSTFGLDPESERDSQEAGLDSVTVPGMKASEGDDKNASLSTSIQTLSQEEKLSTGNELGEPIEGGKGVSSIDVITQHSAELDSFNPGHYASNQQNMDSSSQLPHKLENDLMEDVSAYQLKYESKSEMSLLRMEGNNVPLEIRDCTDNSDIGSSVALLSSADHNISKNIEGCYDDSIVSGNDSAANLLAHDSDVSIEVIQKESVQRQAGFFESEGNICKSEEADKKDSSDLGNIDSENVGTPKDDLRAQSLEVGEGVEGNNSYHTLQPQISGELQSAKMHSLLVKNDASAAVDDRPECGERELATIGSSHLDNDIEDTEMKKIHISILGIEDENASKVEVGLANDSAGIPPPEMSVTSLQHVENFDDLCSNETSSIEAMNLSHSNNRPAPSGCKESNSKEGVDVDLVSGDNHEKARMREAENESPQTPENDKASCGSPTIISSSEPLPTEKDNQEGRVYQVTNEYVKDSNSISEDQKRKDLLGDDSSFTFKVNALPDTSDIEPANNWSLFPDLEKGKSSIKVVEETAPSSKGKSKTEKTLVQRSPRQNARVSDSETGPGTSKGTSERKGRRGPGKATAKESGKKVNQSKGPVQENALEKVEKISNILPSAPISSPHVQFGQMQVHGNLEAINKKLAGAVAVPTSSLPDLNSSGLNNSTSQSGSFRQPFSDLQQVQLRAQIFVYGSLIQGTAPDEACMVSAFGASDGGRSTWEPIWRVAVERVQNQKSSSTAGETPRSRSGARASDAVKQGSHSSKVLVTPTPTPVNRASIKDTPLTVSNPIIPLSSPLWNISTPSRDTMASNAMHKGPVDFQPVHSYQTPPMRNFVGQSQTSWPSQTCFPGPWIASPQTTNFSSGVRFNPVTMTETVKLTPVKDTSAMLVKHMTSSPAVHTVNPSPALGGVSEPKMVSSAENHSLDTKPRKRKKIPVSDVSQVSLVPEVQTSPVVVSDVTNLPPLPTGVSASACWASDVILSKPVVVSGAEGISSVDHTKKSDSDAGKASACSEGSLGKVAEAKSQAEDAADLAIAAVKNCEDLWSQLAKQRDSGLTSEAEAKLASAAVAIAAAASVAKAAAAAAKIACNAALQARLMADEAFLSSKTGDVLLSSGMPSNDMHEIGNATPASILKSNNVSNEPNSVLLAAKEAAKKRIEAASAASKQAENLDAIVKAAELAAAAVSQAGKIVAMGEPLPLNELIVAGPEGYWKLPQPSILVEKVGDGNTEQSGAVSIEKVANISASVPAEDSVEKGKSRIACIEDVHLREGLSGSLNVCMSLSDGIVGSQKMVAKDLVTGIDHKASDTSKSGRVASEADVLEKNTNVKNEHGEFSTHADDGVKEGSLVEVFKPGNGTKSAWHTASVLRFEDGKAYVCYNDLMSEEGSGHLQEWVPIEGEAGKAPIIRAAHPLSSLQYQQTRKRRRAALGDYVWCVGDRVDVWIDDCWWEGVVTEKNEKDETTLKVHISAQGETLTVRAWNLRGSRSWIDGKWIEWSSARRENASGQSDTPQEKRQKLGTPPVAMKAKDIESINAGVAPGKPEQAKYLTLSTNDRTFDIGKVTNDDNKRAARRPLRTNQQKEGSRVIFGVPKPTGKKRKFMEVSKHFPANKSDKSNEASDPLKSTKYVAPQGTASRSWKVPSRNDSKEKRTAAESRSRVLSNRKTHRTLPQRGNSVSTLTQNSDKSMNHGTEDSAGYAEFSSEKSIDRGSDACEEAVEAPLASLLSYSLGTASKKSSSSYTRSDRLHRGKQAPSGGKLSKIEEERAYSASTNKSDLDASEPRRSNRRIQPTHRLLEGLQSSMVIPKMPSVSHDKGRRNLPARGK